MPRILWFALGAIAGTAYASRLIRTERLDDAEAGADAQAAAKPDVQAMKQRMADRLEEGAIRISGFIEEKAHDVADALRGTAAPAETIPEQTPVMAGRPTPPPVAHTAFSETGGTKEFADPTAVLETPFLQTDPAKPAAPILTDTGKPPVMLDRTSDQA